METNSSPDAEVKARPPPSATKHIHEVIGPRDAGPPLHGSGPEQVPPPPPHAQIAPVAPRDRPWVGSRFFGGLAIAVPISILLWAGIIWLIIHLFFS